MKNPFIYHKLYHYYLVFKDVGRNSIVLDYGCGEGEFISKLARKCKKLYGIDVDPDKVAKAKMLSLKIKIKQLKIGASLPFKDNFFDAVTMFHVLEHVDSEKGAIGEISRVLKKDGILYLASPYRGLFTWADTANLRFRFPKLHKQFFTAFVGADEYKKRFGRVRETKMYGDCTASRSWHKHYKEMEIVKLLSKDFVIEEYYKFSFFHPFLLVVGNVFDYFFGRVPQHIKKIIWWDNMLNMGGMSYNFLAIAKKR